MVKINIKKITLVLILIISLMSCEFFGGGPSGYCEAFNFKRIPYDYEYYNRPFIYISDNDSVKLNVSEVHISKDYKLGGLAIDCSPEFSIDRNNTKLSLDYSFNYSLNEGEDTQTFLWFYIKSSHIKLSMDSIKNNIKDSIELVNFEHSGTDTSKFVRKATLKNMLLTEIEEYSGKIWRLVKVGDSIVR